MSFRFELTAGAYADLDRLTAWLRERSSIEVADQFTARFQKALDRVAIRHWMLRNGPGITSRISLGHAAERHEYRSPRERGNEAFQPRVG